MSIWLIILFRSMSMFLITIVLIRLIGKKQPSRLNSFQFVNYMVLGIIAALISVGIIGNLVLGLTALGVWVSITDCLGLSSVKEQMGP